MGATFYIAYFAMYFDVSKNYAFLTGIGQAFMAHLLELHLKASSLHFLNSFTKTSIKWLL